MGGDDAEVLKLVAKTMGIDDAEAEEAVATLYVPTEEHVGEFSESEDFDGVTQDKILALAIRDQTFARRTEGLLRPEYFQDVGAAILMSMAQDYYAKYKQVPQDAVIWVGLIKKAVRDNRIKEDMKDPVVAAYKKANSASLTDREYIMDLVAAFAKTKAYEATMLQAFELLKKGRIEDVDKAFAKVRQIGSTADFAVIDYWDDIEARTNVRRDMNAGLIKHEGITTGYPKLDSLLYQKGWGRKELSVIMGAAKRGKSMGLGDFALKSSMAGHNTLYVTLEVADKIISERMDANVSGTKMDSLCTSLNDVEAKVRAKYGSNVGTLKIVEFPSGSLTPAGLRRVIDKFKADGIVFDMIVVDYADVMKPNVYTKDPIENSKSVWLDLRAIATEENAAVLTATQTNRDGFKHSTAKADDVAEDFNKIRIADIVLSINRTDEERDRGEARLYFAASRNQGGEVTVKIKQDLASMQFITSIIGVE